MRIKVYENENTLVGAAAETAAACIKNAFLEDESAPFRLCLGSDRVNVEMMRELVTEDVTWRNVHLYFQWEFLGDKSVSDISRRKRITYNLSDRLSTIVPSNIHFSSDEEVSAEYAKQLSDACRERFDLVFAELLPGGTVAINIPPCDYDSRSAYINSKDFLGSDCVTVSLFKILTAKRIVVIASGEAMARTVGMMFDEFSANIPATILREHPDFILMCDKEAARFIPACYL